MTNDHLVWEGHLKNERAYVVKYISWMNKSKIGCRLTHVRWQSEGVLSNSKSFQFRIPTEFAIYANLKELIIYVDGWKG